MSSKKKRKILANKIVEMNYKTSTLHASIRDYLHYRIARAKGHKVKPRFTLKQLDQQQKDLNRLRKELGKLPRTIMRDLRKTLKNF